MKISFLHKLWRIACFFFLTAVCSGQVYQSTHLHHFHSDDSIAFKVSAHPLVVDTDHASTHHHHEDNSTHEEDGEHKHKKTAWRKAPRHKSFVNVAVDCFIQPLYAIDLPHIELEEVSSFLPTLHKPSDGYSPFRVIRGPPLLS